MNILHIVAHLDKESSGPSHSVPYLALGLAHLKHGVAVGCLRRGRIINEFPEVQYKSFRSLPILEKLGISLGMLYYLYFSGKMNDIIHSHGLWMFPNLIFILAKRRNNVLICSPRGTLDPAALIYNRKLKNLYWIILQKPVLKSVDAFIVTSKEEESQLRRKGFKKPIAVIPNGVPSQSKRKEMSLRRNCIVFIGRIHPKKGLDILLNAWSKTKNKEWILEIYGEGKHHHELRFKEELKRVNCPNIRYNGPIYGKEKEDVLQGSKGFILTTRGENFGIAVAEALSHGTPAIVTNTAPWKDLQDKNCGMFIDCEENAVVKSLNEFFEKSTSELEKMSVNAQRLVSEKYSWHSIAISTNRFYQKILASK